MSAPARVASGLDSDAPEAVMSRRVHHARVRMLFAHMPQSFVAQAIFALLLSWLLIPVIGGQHIGRWLAALGLLLATASVHAWRFVHSQDHTLPQWYRVYLGLLLLDGLAWGALGWYLTPLGRLDLLALAMACLLGVAALGVFMLNPDARAARTFIVPLLLPNALFDLSRLDSFGVFGGVSVLGFVVLLWLESHRAQRRLEELMVLRYESAHALEVTKAHSEAKSRFLATMSHELRTPLHGIMGLARLLREQEARPQSRQRLSLIERSGEHLLSVINDVLDTSKIESDRVQVDHHAFDLGAAIADVVAVSSVNASFKGLTLTLENTLTDGGGEGPVVLGDAARLRQVLHNLLGNAIKFTEQGGVILRVSGQPGSDMVTLAVQDSGIGIAAAELPFIFEAFHQVDNATQRRHSGTGLGLTIAQKLCRAMGGDLSCTSTPGQGSVFVATLKLPRVAESTGMLTDSGAASAADKDGLLNALEDTTASEGPRLVLVIEDNPVNAIVADAALQQLGLSTFVAEGGHRALAWLRDHQPDLILMDCQMPGMDGFETTQRIRAMERERGLLRAPIVALTANALPQERSRCLEAGMDDHLCKPFRTDDLERVLMRHLRHRPRLSHAVNPPKVDIPGVA
ncbi:MAG: response regulator [Burkholderiales bacterium]|nr:response regulator [Burkholderiales bacterium]